MFTLKSRILVPLALVILACACSATLAPSQPTRTEPCPPEFELRRGVCVYVGGYDIPSGAARDAGR